jgi:hypothetical protein
MKPCIFCNEGEGILNHIMGCSPFPTMGAMKKVGPIVSKRWSQMQWVILKINGWGMPNLVHKM